MKQVTITMDYKNFDVSQIIYEHRRLKDLCKLYFEKTHAWKDAHDELIEIEKFACRNGFVISDLLEERELIYVGEKNDVI